MMTLRHLFFCILCLAFFLVMVPPASAVQPPVAEFDSFGCIGEPPRSVVFLYHYSYGGGLPETWYWDFGDGASSDESSPLHIYSEAGIYDVCLTVENSAGSDTITKTGHVIATPYFPPRAAFTIIPMSDALPDPNSYPPAYFDGAAPCEIRVSDASLGNPSRGNGTSATARRPPTGIPPSTSTRFPESTR
jgi:PKD repeat protein